jgi:hypothetical protein
VPIRCKLALLGRISDAFRTFGGRSSAILRQKRTLIAENDWSSNTVRLAVFVLLARISVAAPVLYYLIAGQSAEKMLNDWKAWLTANNATVTFVLLLVLGVKLVGDGLGGLIG